jgi:hypothetical protein
MTGHVCYQVLTGTAVINLDPAAAVMLALIVKTGQDWSYCICRYSEDNPIN